MRDFVVDSKLNGERKPDFMLPALRFRFICGVFLRAYIMSSLWRSSCRNAAESSSVCASQSVRYLTHVVVLRPRQAYEWFVFNVSWKS